MTREAMQQALKHVEWIHSRQTGGEIQMHARLAANELREALSQPSPAWHDAPTVPGLWLSRGPNGRYMLRPIDPVLAPSCADGSRYFGPIPDDTGAPT